MLGAGRVTRDPYQQQQNSAPSPPHLVGGGVGGSPTGASARTSPQQDQTHILRKEVPPAQWRVVPQGLGEGGQGRRGEAFPDINAQYTLFSIMDLY